MNKNISPHVSIYKFPLTAISSIATRLSGLYLTGAFIGLGLVKFADKEEFYYNKYNSLETKYKTILNYSLIAPATYHTYGGIRHFIWDKYPKLLNNKAVVRSSYLLFGITGISSILFENIIKKNI